jgi:general secretion pathway protein K
MRIPRRTWIDRLKRRTSRQRASGRGGAQFTQRGVAMIAVAACISVVAVLTAEFSTNTTTGWVAATNNRDNMRAEFLARSAIEVAEVLVRAQSELIEPSGMGGMLGLDDVTALSPIISTAIGGSKEEAAAFASAVGLPVDPESLHGVGVELGHFSLAIDSDDGKINLNCANGSEQIRENLYAQLQALFYFDVYNPIFESESADRWRRTRDEQARAIIDYIDRDRTIFGQRGVPEQYGYTNLADPYEAKNNYVDTVGEVRLVRGVDDRFWTLFGDHFTVYGDCKINLSEVDNPRLIASIILLAAEDPEHPVLRNQQQLWELARTVVEASEVGLSFQDLAGFSAFVENPGSGLEALLAAQFGAEVAGQQDTQAGQGVMGVALDADKLNQIARAGTRRTYRVTATAQLGHVEKRVVAVWDTNTHNQNMRDPAYSRGAWVFWREE